EVQILKALILGEEERGQSQYQVVCFIFHFDKDSFISSDAMSKLRQKNPSTIRTPEEDLGRTNYTMDYTVVLPHSGLISPYISDLCAEAGEATYTRHVDLVLWAAAQELSMK
ncbi:OAF domain containing protein, partial [Asbolus verrucosus]